MLLLHVEADHGHFRRPYAKAYGETFLYAPPATIYGMLLSLVGEYDRERHKAVRMAFAYRTTPEVSTTLHRHSRLKYGQAQKQEKKGNQPVYVETACGIDFVLAVDSSAEAGPPTLEERLLVAIREPEKVDRTGVLSLGTSDNIVNEVSLAGREGRWLKLTPDTTGDIDLTLWVAHDAPPKERCKDKPVSFQTGRFRVSDAPEPLGEWPSTHELVGVG